MTQPRVGTRTAEHCGPGGRVDHRRPRANRRSCCPKSEGAPTCPVPADRAVGQALGVVGRIRRRLPRKSLARRTPAPSPPWGYDAANKSPDNRVLSEVRSASSTDSARPGDLRVLLPAVGHARYRRTERTCVRRSGSSSGRSQANHSPITFVLSIRFERAASRSTTRLRREATCPRKSRSRLGRKVASGW